MSGTHTCALTIHACLHFKSKVLGKVHFLFVPYLPELYDRSFTLQTPEKHLQCGSLELLLLKCPDGGATSPEIPRPFLVVLDGFG